MRTALCSEFELSSKAGGVVLVVSMLMCCRLVLADSLLTYGAKGGKQVYTLRLQLWPKVSLLHNHFLFSPAGLMFTDKQIFKTHLLSRVFMAVASKASYHRKPVFRGSDHQDSECV